MPAYIRVSGGPPADYVGEAPVVGTFKSKAERVDYRADFTRFQVPAALAGKFDYDAQRQVISFRGKMSLEELGQLSAAADTDQQRALKNLHLRSDWFQSMLRAQAIVPIKKLRSWAFVLCLLCIGLSTRFRDLATFGLKPFWAFTIGVLVNVPLGYLLTTRVFVEYWRALH